MFALYRVPPDVILPEMGRPLNEYVIMRPADPIAPMRFWREYPPAVQANLLGHIDLLDLVTYQLPHGLDLLPADVRLLLQADARLPAAPHPQRAARGRTHLQIVR